MTNTTDLKANHTTAGFEEELAALQTDVDTLWRPRQDVETRAPVKVRELSLTPP